MVVKKVGVVGTGVMGSGIAQLCGMMGYDTILCGRSQASIDRAMKNIHNSLEKYYVSKKKMEEKGKTAVVSRIKTATELREVGDCDVVIEAIIEHMETKKKLFAQLDTMCPKACFLATDTAGLSVTQIAEATRNPERVVGIHFLSPAPQSRVMELIRPKYCTDEGFEVAKQFCSTFGKEVIITKDTPGFIINRLLTPFVLDAVRLLEQGVATKETIDNAMKGGAGHSVGPIQLLDLAGLDNYCHLADNLYAALGDERLRVPKLMRDLVASGHYGRKTGQGFYTW